MGVIDIPAKLEIPGVEVAPEFKKKMLDYISAHPGASSNEIARALGRPDSDQFMQALAELYRDGKIAHHGWRVKR